MNTIGFAGWQAVDFTFLGSYVPGRTVTDEGNYMRRLTNDTRSIIASAAIAAAFKERLAKLRMDQATIAKLVYDDTFKRSDRECMKSLPNGWLATKDHISVSVENYHLSLRFDGNFSRYDRYFCEFHDKHCAPVERLFPYLMIGKSNKIYQADDGSIGEKLSTWWKDCQSISKEMNETRAKVSATISNFYTVEKLVETWPEMLPFIPETEKPKPQLPALPIADLNKALGL